MNKQEIFDKVVNHLREQGEPAIDSYGRCQYRMKSETDKTLMCAAGCLISDEDYAAMNAKLKDGYGTNKTEFYHKDNIENISIGQMLTSSDFSEFMKDIREETILIGRLQSLHDNNAGNGTWSFIERDLSSVASAYKLKYTEKTV